MMDDSKLPSWLWPTIGPRSERPAPRTTDERLLVLEMATEQHRGQIVQLHQDVSKIKDAQTRAEQMQAARDKVSEDYRAARSRALALIAVLASVGTLSLGVTKMFLDARSPPSHAAGAVSGRN